MVEAITIEAKLIANLWQSRFIALPDAILLQIMHESELSDLYMLRQVSWTFWRLYQDRTFKKLHSSNISSSPSGLTMDESVVKAAKKQAFCQACRTSRESADFRKRLSKLEDSLFCSYCARDHPRLHFSSLWRQNLGHQRFCRLSEGSIQLCTHTSVPLVNLERDLHLATLDWLRSGGRKNLPSPRGWCLEECSVCKEIGEGLSIQEMKPPSLRGEIMTFNTNHGAKSLIRFYTVSWKFPVMPVSDDQPFDDIILETKFKELQGRFGRLLCPHRTFKQLMEPLDPDSELNILESHPNPPLGVKSAFGWAFSRPQWRNPQVAASDPWYGGLSTPRNGRAYATICPICDARFEWSSERDIIYLTRSGGEFTPKVNDIYGWKDEAYGLNGIPASKPTSYGADSDSEAKYILWCDKKACKNGRNINFYLRQLSLYINEAETETRGSTAKKHTATDISDDEEPEETPPNSVQGRNRRPRRVRERSRVVLHGEDSDQHRHYLRRLPEQDRPPDDRQDLLQVPFGEDALDFARGRSV